MQKYPKLQPYFSAAACAALMLAAGTAPAADKSPSPATAEGAPDAAAGSSAAGSTVSDLLARGGNRLDAAEMKAFIPGTQWYTSIVGKPYVVTILPDGTWKGEAGRLPQFLGKWRIDDEGRYCSRLASRSGVAVTADEACLHYYRVGEDYFVSTSTAADAAALPQRMLE